MRAFSRGSSPGGQHDFAFEYLGLVGLLDPVRDGVPAAVRQCYAAGIRVLMITGDYPRTAVSIARLAGFSPQDRYITGADLDAMSDEVLRERIHTVNIVARAVPEQKLRIVNALKANKEVVAMTGDGVNDAPALRAADIGIAMGGRGTDVAREAADLIVTDDNFTSIVQAVRLGRSYFQQSQEGHGLHRCGPCSDRRHSVATGYLRMAPGPVPRSYRVPRAHHRSRVLGRL